MIVVSDTTPIISIMKTGQLELLQKLFGIVYIPKAVYQELPENETFLEEVRIVQECEFLYVEEVGNEKSVTILRKFTGLDAGESEAIILADEKHSDVLPGIAL
ncbi:MAG: DNA-binding protein [Lachnospiraceae bacterium]|nr:DNA-binding protein [Lachnospiraceae bacterium]